MSWRITGKSVQFWTPARITTALWLDADDASTVTLNGSTVSQWNDKSGNGRHAAQGTSSARPTYQTNSLNRKSGILCGNGGPTGFDLPSNLLNSVTSGSVLYVAKGTEPNVTQNQAGVLNDWSSDSNDHEPYNNVIYSRWLSTARYSGGVVPYDLRNGYISRIASSSTAWSYFLNGSLYVSSNANTLSVTTVPKIGLRSIHNYAYTRSVVYEVIFFNSVLSNSDFQQAEGYLAHKWGLTANLPSDHPFKEIPPYV
jgi:hypothetical protein